MCAFTVCLIGLELRCRFSGRSTWLQLFSGQTLFNFLAATFTYFQNKIVCTQWNTFYNNFNVISPYNYYIFRLVVKHVMRVSDLCCFHTSSGFRYALRKQTYRCRICKTSTVQRVNIPSLYPVWSNTQDIRRCLTDLQGVFWNKIDLRSICQPKFGKGMKNWFLTFSKVQ